MADRVATQAEGRDGLAECLLPEDRLTAPAPRIILAASLLAMAFLMAGIGKMLDLNGFAAILGLYRLLPGMLLLPLATLLALAELLVAVALVLPEWRRHVAAAAALLLTLDLMIFAAALWRGLDLAIGAGFGAAVARPLGAVSMIETAALLAMALSLLVAGRRAGQPA